MPPKSRQGSFHFVNARPESLSEKVYIDNLVRTHVGQWNSSHTKKPVKDAEDGAQGGEEETPHPPHRRARKSRYRKNTSSTTGSATTSDALARREDYSLYPCPDTDLVAIIDRFSKPSYVPNSAVQFFVHYTLSTFLPNTFPGSESALKPTSPPSPFFAQWLSLFLTDPVVLSAQMFNLLSHWRVQTNASSSTSKWAPHLTRRCEMDAVHLINAALRDPARATSNGVIAGVLCLAHSGVDTYRRPGAQTIPFDSPLQDLQGVNVYGAFKFNPAHMRGLFQLLRLRGGLDEIDLPGLAFIISSVDILSSSVTLTHPKLPYIALIRSRERLPLLSLLGLTPTDIPLQIRNRQFSPFVSLGLTAQITDLLLAMHIYMITVHDHLTGHRPVHSDPGLAMGLICDRRNRIQYEILSLPSASEVQVLQLDSQLGLLADAEAEPFNPDVYEPTRLAILIYAVGVIRPVPGQHSPLGRLATLLRGSLQRSFPESENGSGGGDADREIWTSNKGRVLKFWILMLGCIAAERSPSPSPSPSPDLRPGSCSRQTSSEREWFVDQLGRTIVGDASIRNWDALRSVLVEMPWSGVACDGPGGRVWVEVEEWLLR